MGYFLVVVFGSGADCRSGMGYASEHRLVQKLIAHPALETLHEAVLHELAGSDVVPRDFVFGRKG